MVLPNRQTFSGTDVASRVGNATSMLEIAEVVEIYPHKNRHPADKNYLAVDVKLRDLKHVPKTPDEECRFRRCNVLQREIGNLTGSGWMPRVGDIVLIGRIDNSDNPIIFGQIYNRGQEPVVSSTDDDFNVSKIDKWSQCERPTDRETLASERQLRFLGTHIYISWLEIRLVIENETETFTRNYR